MKGKKLTGKWKWKWRKTRLWVEIQWCLESYCVFL